MQNTVSETITNFLNEVSDNSFSNSSKDIFKICLADWISVSIAANENDVSNVILSLLEENKESNVNNIYKGSTGYTYIKRPVDPRYWIYQFNKLFEHSDCRWIVVNNSEWQMPEEWKVHKNVF